MDTQFKAVHAEIQAIARAVMRRERVAHTLETDALVSELYLRICGSGLPEWVEDNEDYVRWCRVLMKHTLIEHARGRARQKRGGDFHRAAPAALEGVAAATAPRTTADLMARARTILDEGVRKELITRQQAAVFALGTLFGLGTKEIAENMDVPQRTVQHIQRMTRAYVAAELERRGV